MDEKKVELTDEEIVKALECCAMISVNPYLRGECIDCPYFQKHIDCVEGKRSEMDFIDLIHRLQDENKELKCTKHRGNWKTKFFKAQEKVDELTEERENMQAEIIATEELRLQAVKDTAQEALEAFICQLVNARLVSTKGDLYVEMLEAKDDLLKEKYGVEVE